VYEVEVVGIDPNNDLAVIRIDAGSDLPEALALGDSGQLRVGQLVLAIGNPLGLDPTISSCFCSIMEGDDHRR